MLRKSLMGSLCLLACLSIVARAADDKSDKTPASKKASAKADTDAKSDSSAKSDTSSKSDTSAKSDEKLKGRLPNNYSKVGLSDGQKQKIYSLQASYEAQIDALKKQLSDLDAKRDADIRGVLTADQQKKLDDLVGESSSKKAAKKASASDSKADAKSSSDAKTPADAKSSTASK